MNENHAVDWAGRCDRDPIDREVDRVAQVFEAGDERDIQFSGCQLAAKIGRMIEAHFTLQP